MIDGLKLTMTGAQLRAHLEERIRQHQSEVEHLSEQRPAPDRPFGACPYPDSVFEGEISRAERRIEVLIFIRDYIVVDEVYRLGEFDLRFADLLPDEDWDGDDPGFRRQTPNFRT